jgi:hypothetical protein
MSRVKPDQAGMFVEQVAELHFDNVFNPYSQTCPHHDADNAAWIRCRNLKVVLDAAIRSGVHSFWIARDLGYRGGRRTGLALTDEIHLGSHAALLGTRPLTRATKGPVMAERTAAIVWQMLRAIDHPIFLWNVFPLHPHSPGEPMSNRCHTRGERVASRPLLVWLLQVLRPQMVVAIGRDAQEALTDIGVTATAVRHPSYGGRAEFISSLAEIYDLPKTAEFCEPQQLLI